MDTQNYTVGDRFYDTTDRAKKRRNFEIVKVSELGFIANDVNETESDRGIPRSKHIYSWVAIRALEKRRLLEWVNKGGQEVTAAPEPEAEITEFVSPLPVDDDEVEAVLVEY